MKTKSIIGIAVILLFMVSISGCQYMKKRVEKKEKTSYFIGSTGKQRLEIENKNGNIDIFTSDDTLGTINIIAEKIGKVRIGENDKPIDDVDVTIDTTGDIIRINTNYKKEYSIFGNKHESKVNYIIKVPAYLKMQVTLVNGTITADGLVSDSHFETVNGPVYLNNSSGSIDIETVNGSIKANMDSVGTLTAETVNGSITIGSLKNANANVEAECVNGKVKTENLNFSSMSSERRSLTGKLGNGRGLIKLSTVNGSIKLDGNYISYKKKDHADWNFKFEFDDNDEPVKIEVEHTDEQKGIEDNKIDTIKKVDSINNK